MSEDSFTRLKQALEEHDSPRKAAAYWRKSGLSEAVEDLTVIISKLLSGELPVGAEAAIKSLREADLEDLHFSVETRLESVLDEIKNRPLEDAEPGDFVVYMKETHEQAVLVKQEDDVETAAQAVSAARHAGGVPVGNTIYDQTPENGEWEVAQLQEDGSQEVIDRIQPN